MSTLLKRTNNCLTLPSSVYLELTSNLLVCYILSYIAPQESLNIFKFNRFFNFLIHVCLLIYQ